MGKTKVMICGKGLDTIKPSGKYPCSEYKKRSREKFNFLYEL